MTMIWPLMTFFDLKNIYYYNDKEYRGFANQLKAIDSSIIMKICPDKWEVKWLTSTWPSLTSDDLKT